MRFHHSLLGIALLSGLAAHAQQPAEPSFKYTTVRLYGGFGGYVWGGHTRYFQGRNTRMEFREGSNDRFGPVHLDISNRDLHYRFQLDLAAKVYTATRIDDRGLPVDPPPTFVEWKPSGRTVHIHVETVDTGKRRKMFGYTARRVITRQTTTINPPGDSSQISMETDGWYIDPPAWLRSPHPSVQYVGYGGNEGQEDDLRVTHDGPNETGLPIALKRGPDYERVIEMSEHALDPALFRPPADFKRVSQLPPEPLDYHVSICNEVAVALAVADGPALNGGGTPVRDPRLVIRGLDGKRGHPHVQFVVG
jgi:hypothetical protein